MAWTRSEQYTICLSNSIDEIDIKANYITVLIYKLKRSESWGVPTLMVSAEAVEVKPHKAAPKVKATKVFLNKIKLQMFNK